MPDQLERCITIRHDVAYSDTGAAAAVYHNQMDEYQLATFQQVWSILCSCFMPLLNKTFEIKLN